MPLTQNAPFECGCCQLGATLVTRPSATVTSEPQHTEHSQQVLGKTPSVTLFDAPKSMLFAICNRLQRHPEEVARTSARPSRRMETSSVFVAILRDTRRFAI